MQHAIHRITITKVKRSVFDILHIFHKATFFGWSELLYNTDINEWHFSFMSQCFSLSPQGSTRCRCLCALIQEVNIVALYGINWPARILSHKGYVHKPTWKTNQCFLFCHHNKQSFLASSPLWLTVFVKHWHLSIMVLYVSTAHLST